MIRSAAFFLLFFGLLTEAHAFDDVMFSPVQVVDYTAMVGAADDFRNRADGRAYQDLVQIVYDKYIERPWGSAYWKESDARWRTLRALLCPGLSELCSLPGSFSSPLDLISITTGLRKPSTAKEVHDYFASAAGHRYFADVVHIPGDDASLLNVLVSGSENLEQQGDLRRWDMELKDASLKLKENLVVHDGATYAGSFFGNEPSSYLSMASDGSAVLNVDKIKTKAVHFAKIWKNRVASVKENPAGYREPTLGNFEEFMLYEMYRKSAERFAYHEELLEKRLSELPPEKVGDTAERFAAEKKAGDYPEEVYQYVSYEIFRGLLTEQARYFLLASKFRAKLNLKRQVWESLLSMQSNLDSRTLLFFSLVEMSFPWNLILSQFVNPGVAPAFFFEEVKAILGIREFEGRDIYERYRYALSAPEIFKKEFLKENAPEAYEALLDPGSGGLKDIFSLPAEEQRKIFQLVLFDKEGKLRFYGFYRMAYSLATRLSPEDGSGLARHIHEVREREFHPAQ